MKNGLSIITLIEKDQKIKEKSMMNKHKPYQKPSCIKKRSIDQMHYIWNAYHKYIFFNSCGTQISSFLTSPRLVNWNNFQLLRVIHLTVLQSLAQLHDDSIQLLLSLCYHQLQKVGQKVGHLSMRNLQNEIFKTNSDACILLNN